MILLLAVAGVHSLVAAQLMAAPLKLAPACAIIAVSVEVMNVAAHPAFLDAIAIPAAFVAASVSVLNGVLDIADRTVL
jgi:hypothetical protein